MTINTLVTILFRFMLFFIFFILFLELIFYFLLRKKNNQIDGYKIHLFGLLMELDNFTILALSVALIRFIFIIWTLFDSASIGNVHVVLLIIFAILFGIFSKSIRNLLFESINSTAIYFALIASRLLTNYLVEIRYEWYVFEVQVYW